MTRVTAFRGVLCWVSLTAASAGIKSAAAATCQVPANLLCEGCAEHLSIRIDTSGTCRISFTPGNRSAGDEAGKSVPIQIEVDSSKPRFRSTAKPRRLAKKLPRGNLSAACFDFNGRRFCE